MLLSLGHYRFQSNPPYMRLSIPRSLLRFLGLLTSLLLFPALLACGQQNPVFIGYWRCATLELQLSGNGRYQWEDEQGRVWKGTYQIAREDRAFRIHHTPNQWPAQAGTYIPSAYPVDGFYLSSTAQSSGQDKLVCQRKHTRGTGRLRVWLDEIS